MRLLAGFALVCTSLLVAGSAAAQCGSDPGGTPPGDQCPGTDLGTDPSIVVESTTVGLTNDYDPGPDDPPGSNTCTGYAASGPDGAYQVTVSEGCTIAITYDECPDQGPNIDVFDRSLYFVTDCNDPTGTCLCGSDQTTPQPVPLPVPGPEFCSYNNPGPGSVTGFIIVDGFDATTGAGDYFLSLGTNCPTGACCQGATCTIETENDCTTLSGLYLGSGTECIDCPVAVEQTSWGKIKSIYND